MSIIEDYARQYKWRRWHEVLDALPQLEQERILDLGCGIGDIASDLSNRGAIVVGIDANEDLIRHARTRNIPNAEFRIDDLNTYRNSEVLFDGIWASFIAAYFPALTQMIHFWQENLRPGGWIALTEIDDLFGHRPISAKSELCLSQYVDDALAQSRYDFRMGRKLNHYLTQASLPISNSMTISDAEFSFAGAASRDIVDAWRARFNQMYLLREFCGEEFDDVRDDFLECLQREDQ